MRRLFEIGDKVLPYEMEIEKKGGFDKVAAIIEVPFKYLFGEDLWYVKLRDIPSQPAQDFLTQQVTENLGLPLRDALDDFAIESMYIDAQLDPLGDEGESFIPREDNKNTYELIFHVYFNIISLYRDEDGEVINFVSEPSVDATGLGGAPIIFSTILKFVGDVLESRDDIGTVLFTADKTEGESRARLYKLLANKHAPNEAFVIASNAATEYAIQLAMKDIPDDLNPETARHLNAIMSEVPRLYDGSVQTAVFTIIMPVES